jgi:hypothetical protein
MAPRDQQTAFIKHGFVSLDWSIERKVMNVGRLHSHASAHVERVYLVDFINDAIPVHLLARFVVVEGAGDVLMQDQLHIESRLVAKDVHVLVVLVVALSKINMNHRFES